MTEFVSRSVVATLLAALWFWAHDPDVYNSFYIIINGLLVLECLYQVKTKEWSAICLLSILGYKYYTIVRILPQEIVLMYIAMCNISDISQYFTGRVFGSKPLFTWVSRSKTLEGYIGGLVSVLMLSFYFDTSVLETLWIFVSGISGDLCASAFKRTFNIKHFSSLLGGHGGIIDRFDSTLGVIILS